MIVPLMPCCKGSRMPSAMSQKSKILLIGSLPPPVHGSNIYFENLLHSRIQEEFDVYHLDTSDHRNQDNFSKLDFINVYLALKHLLKLFWKLIMIRPAMVYIPPSASFLPYLRDGLFILFAHFFSRARIIIHLHVGTYFRDQFYDQSNPLVRIFIRWTLHYVDTAVVLGTRLKRIVQGLVKHIVVAPNGTDFLLSGTTQHSASHHPPDIVISFLGTLLENKGIWDTIQAVDLTIQKFPNCKFRFAGVWWAQDIGLKDKIMDFINAHHLGPHVDFVGRITGAEKELFLHSSDIFLFPTWHDTFPLVILEAMAAGCPVISTKDIGAIPEVVIEGVTGLLVEKKNPQQIFEALITLIENPQQRREMGNAGRQRVEKMYRLKHNMNRIIEIFLETLNLKH